MVKESCSNCKYNKNNKCTVNPMSNNYVTGSYVEPFIPFGTEEYYRCEKYEGLSDGKKILNEGRTK